MGCLVMLMAWISIATFLSIGDRAKAGQQGAHVLEDAEWNVRVLDDAQILPARPGHPDRNAAATAVDIHRLVLLLSVPFPFPLHHHPGAALRVVGIGDFYGPNMSVMMRV
jgi:hypothetical protein